MISIISEYKYKIIITLIVFLSFYILFSINPKSLFIGDNLIKLVQANAIIENDFISEEVKCKIIKEFGECKYILPNFNYINNKLIGPFPIYQSYFMALIIYFFNPTFIIFISVILFLITLLVIYKIWKIEIEILLMILLSTPILFHFIGFLDVAISVLIITISISIINVEMSKTNLSWIGFISGISVWFRPESIIFLSFFILLIFIFKINIKFLYYYLFFLLASILIFLLINLLNYNNVLGTRIMSNQADILNFDLISKLRIVKSLLMYGDGRYGTFGYMPYLSIFIIIYIINIKDIPKKFTVLFVSSILSIVSISILSPNNSNIDWGSRYVTNSLIPILLSFTGINKNHLNKLSKIVLSILLIYSMSITVKYYNFHKSMSKEVIKIDQVLQSQSSDLWIFSNQALLNFSNVSIISQPILFLKDSDDINELSQIIQGQSKINSFSFFQINPMLYKYNPNSIDFPNPFYSNLEYENQLITKFKEKFDIISYHEDIFMNSYTFKIK